METWFIIFISICISFLLKSLISTKSSVKLKLPPGPSSFPIISNFLWLRKSFAELEPILRTLHAKYGPIITLRIGTRPAIFIATRSLAHQALVQNGATFATRPKPTELNKIFTSNQHSVTSAPYGPLWRLLRRNLTSEMLHVSRFKCYSHARRWVLDILVNRLKSSCSGSLLEKQAFSTDNSVKVIEHFQFAMFSLLVLMCFGDKLDEREIKKIEDAQRTWLLNTNRFNILNFWPKVGKIVFRKRWEDFFRIRGHQEEVLRPLIRARRELKEGNMVNKEDYVLSYVDTLLDFELPDEKRKLTDREIFTLCSEFLYAGTDTTSTALQWIMANLVKYPDIQRKVYEEIKGVVGSEDIVKEEDLQKMDFLKAVVLEALRRHPPAHLVLPHAVTEDIELGGYLIPKDCSINFLVAEMGWDPEGWENPMEFKPERFLNKDDENGEFDITGSREIKMMPFGAGRRICPGLGLAMLHLEYFVANLVWSFEWIAVDDVDLSEKQEFTMVMKNPLRARLLPRDVRA